MTNILALGWATDKAGFLEAAVAAATLAQITGQQATIISLDGVSADSRLSAVGLQLVEYCDPPISEDALPHTIANTIVSLANSGGADLLLISADGDGDAIAALVAGKLSACFVGGCVGAEVVEGELQFQRRMTGGKVIEVVRSPTSRTVVSVARGVFSRDATVAGTDLAPAPVHLEVAPTVDTVQRVESEAAEVTAGPQLETAHVVIAGGRGVGVDGFETLRALATQLDGAVGASRAAVDMGWMPHSLQVGQTGKTVTPDIYIAVGISGAPQHLAGMTGSRLIIAINSDEQAPIFDAAHVGVVGDFRKVIPALAKALETFSRIAAQ